MRAHLTPIEVCEALIGPIETVAVAAGLNRKAAYRWRAPSQYRDAGDIPLRAARRLLTHAAAHGIPLTEAHLIWGAPRHEIERLRLHLQPAAKVAS